MKSLSVIISVVLAALLWSCADRATDARLARAEALMMHAPDSALAVLDSVDATSLHGDRNRALYGLLLTQARHKNDMPQTDDSLIRSSLRFFQTNGPDSCTMLSHFYRAAVRYNAMSYDTALVENLKALEIAKDLDDTYWKARTYEQIADNYYICYNSAAAIPYLDSANICYRSCGKTLNALYTQLELSNAYQSDRMYDEALAVLDSMDITEFMMDSVLLGLRMKGAIRPLMRKGKYAEALKNFRESQRYFGKKYPQLTDYPDIAMLFIKLGEPDSASFYLEIAKSLGDIPSRAGASEQAEYYYQLAYGSPEKALSALSEAATLNTGVNERAIECSLPFLEKEHYVTAMLAKQYHDRIRMTWLGAACAIIALAFLATLVFVRLRLRDKRMEIVLLSTQRDAFEQSVRDEAAKGAKLEAIIAAGADRIGLLEAERAQQTKVEDRWRRNTKRLMQLRGELIDALASDYFLNAESSTDEIYRRIQAEIARFKTPGMRAELEALVDDCCGGLVASLRKELPSLKENHLWFVVLKISGFSMRAICIMADISVGNYYNYWTRIRSRIAASDAPSKDRLLDALNSKHGIMPAEDN